MNYKKLAEKTLENLNYKQVLKLMYDILDDKESEFINELWNQVNRIIERKNNLHNKSNIIKVNDIPGNCINYIETLCLKFHKYNYTNKRKHFRTFKWYCSSYDFHVWKAYISRNPLPENMRVKFNDYDKISHFIPSNITFIIKYN